MASKRCYLSQNNVRTVAHCVVHNLVVVVYCCSYAKPEVRGGEKEESHVLCQNLLIMHITVVSGVIVLGRCAKE